MPALLALLPCAPRPPRPAPATRAAMNGVMMTHHDDSPHHAIEGLGLLGEPIQQDLATEQQRRREQRLELSGRGAMAAACRRPHRKIGCSRHRGERLPGTAHLMVPPVLRPASTSIRVVLPAHGGGRKEE